jgi:hypothetical protein
MNSYRVAYVTAVPSGGFHVAIYHETVGWEPELYKDAWFPTYGEVEAFCDYYSAWIAE